MLGSGATHDGAIFLARATIRMLTRRWEKSFSVWEPFRTARVLQSTILQSARYLLEIMGHFTFTIFVYPDRFALFPVSVLRVNRDSYLNVSATSVVPDSAFNLDPTRL